MEVFGIILRLVITFILSMLFGIERQKAHKPTGFGAFIFVAMGACGLALAAISIDVENPLPLLASIVTGIGFLGAGAMIKTGDKILGFTTAAGIWLFAIFGLLIGIGEYLIGIIIYVLTWVVILFDRHFESIGIGLYQKKLIIKTNKLVPEKDIKKILLTHTQKIKLVSVEIEKTANTMILSYLIEGGKEELNKVPSILNSAEWLDSCRIE